MILGTQCSTSTKEEVSVCMSGETILNKKSKTLTMSESVFASWCRFIYNSSLTSSVLWFVKAAASYLFLNRIYPVLAKCLSYRETVILRPYSNKKNQKNKTRSEAMVSVPELTSGSTTEEAVLTSSQSI